MARLGFLVFVASAAGVVAVLVIALAKLDACEANIKKAALAPPPYETITVRQSDWSKQ